MSTYHHDYHAFDRLVLCAPFMLEEMGKRAEAVKARAEVTAPFDAKDSDGEHYRDAFSVSVFVREEGSRRAVGQVSNDNSAALIVEFGNSKTPRHRTLGNALDAASL